MIHKEESFFVWWRCDTMCTFRVQYQE